MLKRLKMFPRLLWALRISPMIPILFVLGFFETQSPTSKRNYLLELREKAVTYLISVQNQDLPDLTLEERANQKQATEIALALNSIYFYFYPKGNNDAD